MSLYVLRKEKKCMIMAPDVSYTLVSDLVTVYLLQFLSDKCNQDISLYCRNQKKESEAMKW